MRASPTRWSAGYSGDGWMPACSAVTTFRLFSVGELKPGEMRAVDLNKRSLVVVRKRDGTYVALRNRCPHQGAPLSKGKIEPLTLGSQIGRYEEAVDRDVLRCPWHGYEFE